MAIQTLPRNSLTQSQASQTRLRLDSLLRSIVMTDSGLLGTALRAHNVASAARACIHALTCGVDCTTRPQSGVPRATRKQNLEARPLSRLAASEGAVSGQRWRIYYCRYQQLVLYACAAGHQTPELNH